MNRIALLSLLTGISVESEVLPMAQEAATAPAITRHCRYSFSGL